MLIIQVLVVLIVAGGVLWLINSYIPMDDNNEKKNLNVTVTVIEIVWLLSVVGAIYSISNIRAGG